MRKVLLSLFAISLLFSCAKNETSVVKTTPEAFNEAAFIKRIEEISENAIRKSSNKGARGKFWKILKIVCSDIGGGIAGALGGLALTSGSTAGGIIGGVAGATAASIKASEQYAISVDATPVFKANLGLAPNKNFSMHVPPAINELNPYYYTGIFHNAQLAKLTPYVSLVTDVTGSGTVQHHDSYNQTMIAAGLSNNAYFKPYYDALLEIEQPYTLTQYRNATRWINILAYDTDQAYYDALFGKLSTYGPFSTTSLTLLRSMLRTIEQLGSIEEVEEYIVIFTRQVLGMSENYPDREVLLQALAVAAYSADFWYTMNE
jgi:hypothetical protein